MNDTFGAVPTEILKAEEVERDYKFLFDLFKAGLHLSDEDAIMAVSISVAVCHRCYENVGNCQCWNDE